MELTQEQIIKIIKQRMKSLKEERAAYGELEYLIELILNEDERNADGIDL